MAGNVFQGLWIRCLNAVFKSRILSAAYISVVENNLQRCGQYIGRSARSCRENWQVSDADLSGRVLLPVCRATDKKA
jgi:hypothetical protein